MKIAVMLRTLDVDQGISIYSRNLMRALLTIDAENEYYFLYAHSKWVGSFGNKKNLHEIVVPTKSKFFWDQYGVPRIARRVNADIIFNTKFSVPLASRARTMLVLHGSEWYVHPEFYSRIDMLYNKLFFPVFCSKAAAISAVSQTSADDIVKFLKLPRGKVHVVHSAIAEQFRRIEDQKKLARCKERYKLPSNYILFVGNIYPGKNFGNIVRAFKLLRDKVGRGLKLVSVGDMRWDYEPELQLVKDLGLDDDIIFTGWVDQDDLPTIYSLAKVFLFPSFYEGFGIPILEAMACGCPVVTANTGACPEIANSAALYVDPNDPHDIAEKVIEALKNEELANGLVTLGLERAKEFSWERAATKTLAVFEEIYS